MKQISMIQKKYWFFLYSALLLLLTGSMYGATTQWASKVIDFTSELQQGEYGSLQLLGRPNAMPYGEDSKYAWRASGYYNVRQRRAEESSLTQVLQLGYKNPMYVSQIAVAESMNPGAVKVILLNDEEGNEHKVLQGMVGIINAAEDLVVQFEYAPQHLEELGCNFNELFSFIQEHKFKVYYWDLESNKMLECKDINWFLEDVTIEEFKKGVLYSRNLILSKRAISPVTV